MSTNSHDTDDDVQSTKQLSGGSVTGSYLVFVGSASVRHCDGSEGDDLVLVGRAEQAANPAEAVETVLAKDHTNLTSEIAIDSHLWVAQTASLPLQPVDGVVN